MPHKIIAVEAGSIADQLGIRPGDSLVTINGKKIIDWIDYQAFCSEEDIDLVTERDGEEIEYSLGSWSASSRGTLRRCISTSTPPIRSCARACSISRWRPRS